VICHDRDAPFDFGNGPYGFVHCVHYNIAGLDQRRFPKAATTTPKARNNLIGKTRLQRPDAPEGHGQAPVTLLILALDSELKSCQQA